MKTNLFLSIGAFLSLMTMLFVPPTFWVFSLVLPSFALGRLAAMDA